MGSLGSFGDYWASRDPFSTTKQRQDESAASEASKNWGQASQGVEKNLEGSDTAYSGKMNGYTSEAQNSIKGLSADADMARKNSGQTYSTTIQPQLKNMMEQAQGNAGGAMSLQDAMDPNNKVAASTRQLYETQARNEDRQNLASTGMLQAMGQQNMATTLGSAAGPMTGGQLASLFSANQQQAGDKYARDQVRTQSLRDQGRDMGFQRSDTAYNQGLDAQDRYRRSVGDYESADARQQANQAGYRGELGGYAGDEFNLGAGQAGLEHGMAASQAARQEALLGRQYGTQIANANAAAGREAAAREGNLSALGGGIGMVSNALGGSGMFGKSGAFGKDSGVSADKGGGDVSTAGATAGGTASDPNAPDYVSQSSQNGYAQDGYTPGSSGYSNAGSSSGASGQMQTTGGLNLTNRMATMPLRTGQTPGAAQGGQAGGRLSSLMVPQRDWTQQQKAWQQRNGVDPITGAQPMADVNASAARLQGLMQNAQKGALHNIKGLSSHPSLAQLDDEERKKKAAHDAYINQGYASGRVSTPD